MADGEKRIVELTEVQSFGDNDYLALDNINNTETKKIKAKKLGITYTITDTEDGFIFQGDNGYSHEIIVPKDAQMYYEDYVDLTEDEKMDNSNRFVLNYPSTVAEPEIWQRVGRTPLETSNKIVSTAINELKGRIDGNDDDITEIKSNLTEKASRLLTWVFSSAFSRGASYDASSWWDNASEIILMVSNNDTGTNASYWEIHYYKNFEDMTIVNGYGLGGNTFAQVAFNKTNKSITMVDCRMGGTQYNPFCKLYYR